tara:strand:- start:668 stop:1747 length:1080 start_codon:yes stop_codon:yes gene_type:complete
MTNAIIKSNLKDKVTKAGNYAKLSRDEKTGELMYTLYDAASNQPTGATMTIKEFNKNIKDNVKDVGNTIGTALGEIENSIADIGLKSKSGVMDEQTKQLALNRLDALLQSPSDIKRAMMSKYGYSNTSFFDDIKNPSALSASLYSTLMNATGKTKDGEILPQGILEGVKDTDGSGGISKAELQDAKNYMVLSSNIVGMKDPTVSKELFKEYTANRMNEAHKYGYSKRRVDTNDGGDKNKFGLDADTRYFTMGADQNYARIYGRDIENAVETFKAVQDKGSGIFTGYDDVPHKLKSGKWFTYNSETDKFDIPSNPLSIFTALGWNNNSKIMEYLKVKGMDYDGDGIIDTAPKKPIEFTTY